MGETSGIRAGKAFLELSVTGPFNRQIDAAAKKLNQVGQTITDIGKKTLLAGSAITAPLLVAAQRFAAMGSEINDAAVRTGIGVVAIQELMFAAQQTGAAFEDVETAVKKMQKQIFEAAGGSKTAREALAGLGLTVEQLKSLKPEDQFALIAERLSNIADPTVRNAVAMEIFGKSGTKLIPMMQELAAQKARLHELGGVFSPEDVAMADQFGDTLDEVWTQLKAVTFHIGAAVAQALLPFAGSVQKILRTVIDWAKENRGVIFTVLALGGGLIALGGALLIVGLGIKAVGFALSGITSMFKGVSVVIGLLSNPIILIGGLLLGLVAYFVYASGNGGKLMDWLADKFTQLKETASITFGGIADALSAGDIGLAAQILWAGLKLAWAQGTQELHAKWINFKTAFTKVAIEAFYGVLDAWAIVKAALESLFYNTAAVFVNAWHRAVQEVTKMFDFLERKEREREKVRIQRELNKPGLAKNVRELLVRQLANVDEQAEQVLAARDETDKQDAADREKQLQDKLAAIKSERDKKLTENVDAEKALTGAADQNGQQEIADLDKKKKELEQQLAVLRGKAGDEKKKKNDEGPSLLVKPDKLAGLDDVLAKRANVDVKSAGLFNVNSLQSLQSSSSPTQDAIKKAAEQTAKNTKTMIDRLPAFT